MASFATLNVTVTTAGTRVQASSTELWVKKAIIRSDAGNTGNLFIGTVTVSSTVGLHMEPADPPIVLGDLEIGGKDDFFNLEDLYVDASANAQKLTILYFT